MVARMAARAYKPALRSKDPIHLPESRRNRAFAIRGEYASSAAEVR